MRSKTLVTTLPRSRGRSACMRRAPPAGTCCTTSCPTMTLMWLWDKVLPSIWSTCRCRTTRTTWPPRCRTRSTCAGPHCRCRRRARGLVAVHLACQSILNGECEMALAGGDPALPHQVGYCTPPEHVSPTGHCRAFDAGRPAPFGRRSRRGGAQAAGRRLDDGDSIHGLILGSAVNNDGATKTGWAAP